MQYANLGLPSRIVQLALHSVVMQQMKLTGMQACSHAAAMQQKCTGAHTHARAHKHTHAQAHTHKHARAHKHMHRCTYTHMHKRTHA